MVPYKFRSRRIEQIMFRNAATKPMLFKLKVKTESVEFESAPTFESVIVSTYLPT
jgi:hypothetical protein